MIKRLAASAAALVAILIVGPANAQTDRAADKAAVEKKMKEYFTTFLANDDEKVASYFHEPWMQIGTGKALNTDEAEKWWAEFRKSRPKDYDHFNVKQLSVKMLGKDLAMVSYIGERQAIVLQERGEDEAKAPWQGLAGSIKRHGTLLGIYCMRTPRKVPMSGNPTPRKVPVQEVLPHRAPFFARCGIVQGAAARRGTTCAPRAWCAGS